MATEEEMIYGGAAGAGMRTHYYVMNKIAKLLRYRSHSKKPWRRPYRLKWPKNARFIEYQEVNGMKTYYMPMPQPGWLARVMAQMESDGEWPERTISPRPGVPGRLIASGAIKPVRRGE